MHVAVLGAGYAGLALVRHLEDDLPGDVDLTVVDERDTHLVQHLVHRVIRRPALAGELRLALADLLDRATHRQARVERVDPDAGRAALSDGELSYDVGAVCLGAETDFHDLPGVAEHGTPLKRIRHAESIRADVRALCEAGGGRVVVGGAGLSGIQAAGEIAALAREEGVPEDLQVRLVEAKDSVAPGFQAGFRRAVASELGDRGVRVETGRAVARANAESVGFADGSELACDLFVWTGGIAGRTALGGERPRVHARLRLGERTFGLGDAVEVIDAAGTAVPASAKTALAQAEVAATNVRRLVADRREGTDGFEPRLATYRDGDGTWLVTVGDGTVATVGPTVLRGRAARTIKSAVGARYRRSLAAGGGLTGLLRGSLGGRV